MKKIIFLVSNTIREPISSLGVHKIIWWYSTMNSSSSISNFRANTMKNINHKIYKSRDFNTKRVPQQWFWSIDDIQQLDVFFLLEILWRKDKNCVADLLENAICNFVHAFDDVLESVKVFITKIYIKGIMAAKKNLSWHSPN